jgi:hypothetical protein
MKVIKVINEVKAKSPLLKWRAATLFIAVIMVVLILTSITPAKEKATANCHIHTSYGAGDVALFVAMPLLSVVMR